MGQMTGSSILEIVVHLLSEFTKKHDPEILLTYVTFHPPNEDKFMRTSGNSRNS